VAGARAGVILTPNFLNSTAQAPYVADNGNWMDAPDAALHGTYNGSHRAVVMSLSSPQYDSATKVGFFFHFSLLDTVKCSCRFMT
jgi:hypothetical protein